ncbi:Uncharacterised protein [Actinobacillus indolicus]|nr:Uncharacterised protein [Actinobacillus indolicus]VTU06665.1 Uncharacterised protein [Actinobacillus indolicus]
MPIELLIFLFIVGLLMMYGTYKTKTYDPNKHKPK